MSVDAKAKSVDAGSQSVSELVTVIETGRKGKIIDGGGLSPFKVEFEDGESPTIGIFGNEKLTKRTLAEEASFKVAISLVSGDPLTVLDLFRSTTGQDIVQKLVSMFGTEWNKAHVTTEDGQVLGNFTMLGTLGLAEGFGLQAVLPAPKDYEMKIIGKNEETVYDGYVVIGERTEINYKQSLYEKSSDGSGLLSMIGDTLDAVILHVQDEKVDLQIFIGYKPANYHRDYRQTMTFVESGGYYKLKFAQCNYLERRV